MFISIGITTAYTTPWPHVNPSVSTYMVEVRAQLELSGKLAYLNPAMSLEYTDL